MCCNSDTGLPGSDGSIVVEDEGASLGSFTALNFIGAGVTATDAGGGVADITIPGGSVDTKQVFRYVATGAEANPFVVPLPAARASANYNVQITMGGPAANPFKDARALVASFTINDFEIELGAGIDAGDIFMITVEDLT